VIEDDNCAACTKPDPGGYHSHSICYRCERPICRHCDQGEGGYGDDGTGYIHVCGLPDCDEVSEALLND